MIKNKQKNLAQKPLTLNDLEKFTDQVLLPAIENMIDEKLDKKLDEKLTPIYQELIALRQDINYIKQKILIIEKEIQRLGQKIDQKHMVNIEDVNAIAGDVIELKTKVMWLEKQIQILQTT